LPDPREPTGIVFDIRQPVAGAGEFMDELHKQFDFLDTIIEEAVDKNLDQLLLVSRFDQSKLYMLSKGRVKKGIKFKKDIAGAFVEYFSEKEKPADSQDQLQFEMNVTASAGLGKCFLVKINKKS
jgi:hypothetical protein